VPWQPGTAMVLADLEWEDGSPVAASPRQILARQLARLADAGDLKPAVDSTFRLEAAEAAFARLTQRGKHGKVVLHIADG